ncbi:MAG TPA: M24 family metallopeptidase, partial [Dehalococcoidia bacterium]|nr:M24 family metallopeptidase [Dehalococcoidia bacterium]
MSEPLIAPDRLARLQTWLRDHEVDAWLAYDFHQLNPIFGEVFGQDRFSTRRAFVLVPADGEPEALLHFVDQGCFPADRKRSLYRDRHSMTELLRDRLRGLRRVAMEYSPGGELPTIAYVDAGTIELIRGLGPEVVSSADLYQAAFGTWSAEQLASHERAADGLVRVVGETFAYIGDRLGEVDEWAAREFIRRRFTELGLETEHGPIVAVNVNSGNPHYEPTPESSRSIRPGDWVLIDLWAREPRGYYAGITHPGDVGVIA